MMKILLMIILISIIFSGVKSPLMLVMLILTQTILVSAMIYYSQLYFWIPYILILIFLGGMLVIFIYIASLSSNDKLIFKINGMMLFSALILFMAYMNFQNNYITNFEKMELMDSMYLNNKMITTLLMALFLMITLFIIVKISNLNKGPLRKK
uniref:NADH dehydrogenase subunit 6 n=1 Tax=Rhynchothorax sp. JZ-2022 TaxID=2992009 RepID=A0A9E7V7B6_9CHEL|nr:NADH dehydrogenase subunit 6 [Rhynchothorax sp. JZ-2022]